MLIRQKVYTVLLRVMASRDLLMNIAVYSDGCRGLQKIKNGDTPTTPVATKLSVICVKRN